jgi:hypothetical protein
MTSTRSPAFTPANRSRNSSEDIAPKGIAAASVSLRPSGVFSTAPSAFTVA